MLKINFINGYSISNLRKIAKFIFKDNFVKLQQEGDDVYIYVKSISEKISIRGKEVDSKNFFSSMTDTHGLILFREVVLKNM